MWLANALTVSRIPLAIAFCLVYPARAWSLGVIAVAALTDALDGSVARRARARAAAHAVRVSSAGEWLDPVADKFFVVMVVGTLAVRHAAPLALGIAICARELVIVPLGIAYRLVRPGVEHAFKADALGKATTVAQLAAVAALVARVSFAPAAAAIAGALGILAAAHYVTRSVFCSGLRPEA